MTAGELLRAARWLRALVDRYPLLSGDRERLLELADGLEREGLEQAVEERRPGV